MDIQYSSSPSVHVATPVDAGLAAGLAVVATGQAGQAFHHPVKKQPANPAVQRCRGEMSFFRAQLNQEPAGDLRKMTGAKVEALFKKGVVDGLAPGQCLRVQYLKPLPFLRIRG